MPWMGSLAKTMTSNGKQLPAKYWPLLQVIIGCSWRWPDVVAGISARFFKICVCFVLLYNKETVSFLSLESQSLRISGNKIHCSSGDQSLTVYCYIARLSLNKMSTVIGWFLVTCPWTNSNGDPTGIQLRSCCPHAVFVCLIFSIWLFEGKSKYITKHLRYQPGLKKANFPNFWFRDVQIKPFKSFLLKKFHKKILFQCKVIARWSLLHVNCFNYPLTSPVILEQFCMPTCHETNHKV